MSKIVMGIGEIMRGLVKSFLPWPFEEADVETREKTVLVMSLELRVGVDPEERDNVRFVHLMFHRPANYVKVLWAVVDRNKMDRLVHYDDITEWRMESDHDSAWVNDGIEMPFDALAQEMLKEIDPEAELWDKDCTISLSFTPFGMAPKLVHLENHTLDRKNRTFTVEFEPRS